MKKTYTAPLAESIIFETEEILGISYTGNGSVLDDKNSSSSSSGFGKVDLFS